MIPPGDTADLTYRDHAPLLLLALIYLGFLAVLWSRAPERPSSATSPAATTQEHYEREKAGRHELDYTHETRDALHRPLTSDR